MKTFAELNENNLVTNIILAENDLLLGNVREYFASNPAIIGGVYNEAEDIFITPQPYPSWLRTGSFWDAPTPMPVEDGKFYQWVEADLNWQVVPTE